MKSFGLTGGIASGKSTVSRMLLARGVTLIDADLLAREVVEPGQPALARLVEAFGAEVLRDDGSLNRGALGAKVFGDAAALKTLNAITHPAIGSLAASRMNDAREAGAPFVVYDAALIVEWGLHRAMDGLIVVDVSPETQRARLKGRDGLGDEAVSKRIESQMSLADKRAAATWLIDNNGTLEATEARLEEVLEALRQAASVEGA